MTISTRWAALAAASLLLGACNGSKDEEEHAHEFHPTLQFLAPSDGEVVAAGDLQVSIVVEDFELTAPAQASRSPAGPSLPVWWLLPAQALAHNEGMPQGYCELSLDGAVVGSMDSTQLTLNVAAGDHELQGRLLYADGDALEEPVTATVSFRAE